MKGCPGRGNDQEKYKGKTRGRNRRKSWYKTMNSISDFELDLDKGKEGEQIVFDYLSAQLPTKFIVENVSDDPECYYNGDLTIFDVDAFIDEGATIDECTKFVEVKTDDCIGETGNVLCEQSVYYPLKDKTEPGNMQNKGDYYCVVSRDTEEIYLFDFKKLQKIYKRGRNKKIEHWDSRGRKSQITNAYLVNLTLARKAGALLKIINY